MVKHCYICFIYRIMNLRGLMDSKFSLFNLLLFITINHLYSSTYYISNIGNDGNTGLSKTSAWKSIARVNWQNYAAGDSILFEAGTTFSGSVYLSPLSNGTASKIIYIGSYGQGRATISSDSGNGILCYNNSGIKIHNIIFKGNNKTNNNSSGVYFYTDLTGTGKLSNIEIDGVVAEGYKVAGINFQSYTTAYSRFGYNNIKITNCTCRNNALCGIQIVGFIYTVDTLYSHKNVLIKNCIAHNNDGISGLNTHSGSGIVIGQVDTALIIECEAYENGKNNTFTGGGPVGIWAWDSKNITIEHCYSHHNRTQTLDGGGFDLDGGVRNSVMQYNYSFANDGAGYLIAQYPNARVMNNNVVRYNISENDGNGLGIMVWSGDASKSNSMQKIDIYNNSVYLDSISGNTFKGAFVLSNMYNSIRDMRVCNNIFYVKKSIKLVNVQSCQNLKFYNNVYFNADNNFIIEDKGIE